MANKTKHKSNIVTNSIKTLKMIHLKEVLKKKNTAKAEEPWSRALTHVGDPSPASTIMVDSNPSQRSRSS